MATGQPLAECVVNISEGRNRTTIEVVRDAGGRAVLDVHTDPEHHRSVLTLGGSLEAVEEAARTVVAMAVARIDLRTHVGVHPRLGAADVIPFVPLPGPIETSGADESGPRQAIDSPRPDVLEARNRFAIWAGAELQLPCFLYGPERTLPDVRRGAYTTLEPDTGPHRPHPTAGSSAVGARPVLVAYNVWIISDRLPGTEEGQSHALSVARGLAAELRGPRVRSMGFPVGAGAQVSFNLIDPRSVSMADVYDAVAAGAAPLDCSVLRAELVGLVPADTLVQIPRHRWPELDLGEDRTIEGRIEDAG
jgi:glutamate formiminotransferase